MLAVKVAAPPVRLRTVRWKVTEPGTSALNDARFRSVPASEPSDWQVGESAAIRPWPQR